MKLLKYPYSELGKYLSLLRTRGVYITKSIPTDPVVHTAKNCILLPVSEGVCQKYKTANADHRKKDFVIPGTSF